MASTTEKTDKPVNPLPEGGDHDRVTMLSLKADGSPDQLSPEIVGDKDAAKAATREQFAQQAVSAADTARLDVTTEEDTSDAQIDAVKVEHDKIAAAAEKRADKVVDDLYED